MKLPRRKRALVPERKLTDYLLSMSHPVGRAKARFFRKLGFDTSNTDLLTDELLNLARHEHVVRSNKTEYGTKYVIDGLLSTPRGEEVPIRTVWIIEESGQDVPRFITAYPA